MYTFLYIINLHLMQHKLRLKYYNDFCEYATRGLLCYRCWMHRFLLQTATHFHILLQLILWFCFIVVRFCYMVVFKVLQRNNLYASSQVLRVQKKMLVTCAQKNCGAQIFCTPMAAFQISVGTDPLWVKGSTYVQPKISCTWYIMDICITCDSFTMYLSRFLVQIELEPRISK